MTSNVSFENIPLELQQGKHFCCWRAIQDKDKPEKLGKVPWSKDGLSRLSWSNPANLIFFEEAKALYLAGLDLPEHNGQHFGGIGYILNGSSDLVCVDLDNSINEAGEISHRVKAILERFKSYTEISPSRKGLHIWIKARIDGPNIPQIDLDGQAIEIFVRSHHVTITGDVLQGYEHLESRLAETEALYYKLQTIQKTPTANQRKAAVPQRIDEKGVHYVEKALEYESQAVLSESEGNRNNRLNQAAFSIGRYVGAGLISDSDVEQALLSAAGTSGLSREEAETTIQSGLRAGRDNPVYPDLDENDGYSPLGTQPTEENSEIHNKALDILENGDPIQYIADSCGRMVLGSEKAFKKLTCCMSVQMITQSAGLHPKLNGDSSSGKSWIVLTFAHCLPPEAVVKGSTSNLAVFYHPDGDRIFRILDDYLAGNETLDTIIKQTSSVFHQKYYHRTVRKQQPITLPVGSEQTWAITSVDSSQDIQVLNRQIPINTDDSVELTQKVNARTIQRYGKGEEQFPEDETVLICREIWRILRAEENITIKVPFWQRIEWLEDSNRRNPSLFMDLLIAHTAMNRYQRTKDSEGYYLATEEDFESAKALFNDRDAEELVKRLTSRERDVINLLVKRSSGLTRDEIAEALNVAPDRISQIINGQKGYGGLRQKVQIAETKISNTSRLSDNENRTVHKTIYSLKNYDHFMGFDGVVRLKPTPEAPAKQAKYELSIELSKKNAKHRDDLSKISIIEEEREGSTYPLEGSLSVKNAKNAQFAKLGLADSGDQCLADAKPYLADGQKPSPDSEHQCLGDRGDPEIEKLSLVKYPFNLEGTTKILMRDFIFALSLDRKWGPPEKVRKLAKEAVTYGWLKMEGDGNNQMAILLSQN